MNESELRKLKDSGPYDHTLEEGITMYDKTPYMMDINVCSKENIAKHSGNVIKSYCYKIGEIYQITSKGKH